MKMKINNMKANGNEIMKTEIWKYERNEVMKMKMKSENVNINEK